MTSEALILFWTAVAIYALTVSLGSASCADREYDARGSTCLEYNDDGYEPTREQRLESALFYTVFLGGPVLSGFAVARGSILLPTEPSGLERAAAASRAERNRRRFP